MPATSASSTQDGQGPGGKRGRSVIVQGFRSGSLTRDSMRKGRRSWTSSPATSTSRLTFHVPPDLAGEGVDALIDRLRSDPEVAAYLADHLRPRLDGGEGRQVIVAGTSSGRHEGRTLAAIAEEAGKDVGVVGVELLISEAPAALLIYAWQAADATWDQIMRRTLEDPR